MYLIINEENEFHKKLNPVAMAKRQIPNGYKNTLVPLKRSIKPLKLKEMDENLELDEDVHLRSRILSGEQNRKDSKKLKFRRANFIDMDRKDYDYFLKKNSSPRQYREILRDENKRIKRIKKIYNTDEIFRLNHTKTNDNTDFSSRSFIRNQDFEQIKNSGASYNPVNRTIMINKTNAIYKDPLLRHKSISHEIDHSYQDDYAKAKEGKQGCRRMWHNQFQAIGAYNTDYDINNPKYLNKYMNSPLEYQAFKTGSNINSIYDRPAKFDPKMTEITLNKKTLKKAIKSEKFQIDQNTILKQLNTDPSKYSSQEEYENDMKKFTTPRFRINI